jgi:hypothetical protein
MGLFYRWRLQSAATPMTAIPKPTTSDACRPCPLPPKETIRRSQRVPSTASNRQPRSTSNTPRYRSIESRTLPATGRGGRGGPPCGRTATSCRTSSRGVELRCAVPRGRQRLNPGSPRALHQPRRGRGDRSGSGEARASGDAAGREDRVETAQWLAMLSSNMPALPPMCRACVRSDRWRGLGCPEPEGRRPRSGASSHQRRC